MQEILNVINHSTATVGYHRFSSIPGYPVVTDGVLLLAESADCYWLLDIIGSYQSNQKLDRAFQVWILKVNREDESAVVHGYNDMTIIITHQIPYTDFPLDELKLYLINGVILLPSEY